MKNRGGRGLLISGRVPNRILEIHFGRPTLSHLLPVYHIYTGINTIPTALPATLVAVTLQSSLATGASEGTNAIQPSSFTLVDVLDVCSASSRPARFRDRSTISRQDGRTPVHA